MNKQTIAEQYKEINKQIKDAHESSGSLKRQDIELLWFAKTFKSQVKQSDNGRTFKVTFNDNSVIEFDSLTNNLIN